MSGAGTVASGGPVVRVDVAVVGGGIVGLAVVRALHAAAPGLSVALVEKEAQVAAHQTGRNSGVVHSGLYYDPASLKARTVATGRRALLRYCEDRGIDHEVCGKVVVAVSADEVDRLHALEERGRANGLAVRSLDPAGLRALEPHVRGVAALHVPEAAIVDFRQVAEHLRADAIAAGVDVLLGAPVVSVQPDGPGVRLVTPASEIAARRWVNCAGLHCDHVARLAGVPVDDLQIVPFRGEYHELVPERRHLVRALVYPVPDPDLPFLGVHLTRSIDGGVHAGPNAVLALRREGYRWRDVDRAELAEILRFPGFRRLARRYWRTGATEVARSVSARAFVRALRRLVPELGPEDVVPAPAGVRAQALRRDGTLVDDFELRETANAVHVLNAPSPAATASLAIGRTVAERVLSLDA